MTAYASLAQRRLTAMRDALDEAAEDHGLPLTVQQLDCIADVITRTLYPADGRPDPALGIGRRTHARRTGDALSDLELVVLRYAANGCTNAEIGRLVGCSENTVKGHMRNVRRKLGARNAAHATALYVASDGYTAGDVPVPEGGP